MDNDDLPIGRVLDRRDAVKLLAMTGAAVLVGCNRSSAASSDTSLAASNEASGAAAQPVPGCIVRPELTVGPYFVDHQLERSDITTDPGTGIASPGVPLSLTFTVSEISGGKCVPLQGAIVDVWHCDASGRYSAVNDRMEGFNTLDKKFLRGFQKTSDIGVANFTTIYPGWYRGRTVHIHFKIRALHAGKQYDFTSQLFFDDAFSDKIFARAPYSAKGARDPRNSGDGIFRQAGDSLLLRVGELRNNDGQLEFPYMATFDIALDLSDARGAG